jgi:hypothetical protein
VTTTVHRRRKPPDFYDDALRIVCGKSTEVYSTAMPIGGGINAESSRVQELPTPTGELAVYTLRRTDSGERPGSRPMLDLDTRLGKAVVWRDGLSAMHVELSLDKTSAPALRVSTAAERIDRTGTVQSIEGPAPMKVGAECAARAVFTGQGWECVALVVCGGKTLVASERAACDLNGRAMAAVRQDSEGQVHFQFDRAGAAMVVEGATPKPWSATVTLAPPP